MRKLFRNIDKEMPVLPVRLVGALDVYMTEPKTGRIVEERHVKNDIVDGGEIWIAELLAGEELAGSQVSYDTGELGYGLQYVQVGSDGTQSAQTFFSMQSTSGITGDSNTYWSQITAGGMDVASPGNEIVARGTFVQGEGNGALQEAGLFSNSTEPGSSTDTVSRMFNRTTFATINKSSSFELTFQWTITIGSVA